MREFLDVLVVSATVGEQHSIAAALVVPREDSVGGRRLLRGSLGGRPAGLLETGVGKTNAGLALGAVLERWGVGLLLCVGVGGAYPGAGLGIGGVAVATAECYGDEGVEAADGFRGMEETGIPLWEGAGEPLFNRFPADPGVAAGLVEATLGAGVAGVFVTVSTVTGTEERARWLANRFEGVCETMEGAAYAHAAASRGIRYGEVRGISNLVGPRDRGSWRIAEAGEAAQAAALAYLLRPGGGGGPA